MVVAWALGVPRGSEQRVDRKRGQRRHSDTLPEARARFGAMPDRSSLAPLFPHQIARTGELHAPRIQRDLAVERSGDAMRQHRTVDDESHFCIQLSGTGIEVE